jgi:hypothetical protein
MNGELLLLENPPNFSKNRAEKKKGLFGCLLAALLLILQRWKLNFFSSCNWGDNIPIDHLCTWVVAIHSSFIHHGIILCVYSSCSHNC